MRRTLTNNALKFQVEIEQGKTLIIQMLAEGKLNKKGEREVFFELNGTMLHALYPTFSTLSFLQN